MALALRPHAAVERLVGECHLRSKRHPQLLNHVARAVVDIAPGVGAISPEFREYLTAMSEIDAAKVKSRKEADVILQKYEKVST